MNHTTKRDFTLRNGSPVTFLHTPEPRNAPPERPTTMRNAVAIWLRAGVIEGPRRPLWIRLTGTEVMVWSFFMLTVGFVLGVWVQSGVRLP